MDISGVTAEPASSSVVGGSRSIAALGSDDFFRLLIAQLANQDPLEPVGNEELLGQISSIREIELSATLTESLRSLTSQQGFGSASALIGRYVTGLPGPDGVVESGLVVGLRIAADGRPVLQLSGGAELSLDRFATIELTVSAGEALGGKSIVGVDRRDPADPELVEGVVTGVRVDENSEVLLELDTGEDLRLRDFVSVAALS